MPSSVLIKALGLNLSANPLDVPEGSLLEANDVIIDRDNVIEPRRGFKVYGTSFPSSSDRAKQLFVYRDRILRHYSNKLQFDDGNGNFSDFSGTFSEVTTGTRIKSVQSNGNFYFTSDDGIKKISASAASQLTTNSGFITSAGGVKALDMTGRLTTTLGDQSSFFDQDSVVAYRHIWGITDVNNNLILGTPSQRLEIANPLLTLMLQDYMRILGALDDLAHAKGTTAPTDGFSLIDDANYVSTHKLAITATASDLFNKLKFISGTSTASTSLTMKIDKDIVYADLTTPANGPLVVDTSPIGDAITVTAGNKVTIHFSSGNPQDFALTGNKIVLINFILSTAGEEINGPQTLTAVDPTSISFINPTTVSIAAELSSAVGIIESGEYRTIGASLVTDLPTISSPPTNDQLRRLQRTLQRDISTQLNGIIDRLQNEPIKVIPKYLASAFISSLDLTKTSTVTLEITIPPDINSNYFLQIYRSSQSIATGTTSIDDLVPSDEMRLVYEAFPTTAELAAKQIIVTDIVPDDFRAGNANLYTNEISGEGILNSNEPPPFAIDINKFKNVTFYANTRTRHRKSLALLGVTNLVSGTSKLMTSNATIHNTYDFTRGVKESFSFTVANASSVLNGDHFKFFSAEDKRKYYVYYNTGFSAIGTGSTITITTHHDHNLAVGDKIKIFASTSTPSIDNTSSNLTYTILTVPLSTTFTISVSPAVTGAGTGTIQGRWLKTFDGTGADEFSGFTGIRVDLLTADTTTITESKTRDVVARINVDFDTSSSGTTFTITNTQVGYTTDATAETSGHTSLSITQGKGERASTKEILLSTNASVAEAIDETARSLVRIINKNSSEATFGFYLSGATDTPGKFSLEARTLNPFPFVMMANNTTTGASFNPDISPDKTITAISLANPTVITAAAHGLVNGDTVVIAGSNSTPSADGIYTVTLDQTDPANKFSIPVNVTIAGTTGSLRNINTTEFSSNDAKPNRIFFSKLQQPEAVPLLNFFDVGSETDSIVRIFPLRDSLFVFKSEGLFRISGETSPFSLALFDTSTKIVAGDSVDVANNNIYLWTTQGIMTVSEAGANIISRSIDVEILKLATAQFTNFKTATWGVGYDSDNSYTVYTVQKVSDTIATIGYRYGNLTNSWTRVIKSPTCGVVNPKDDKLYLGAGDLNVIEQERKDFARTDHTDREITTTLTSGNYLESGSVLQFATLPDVEIGDAVVQEQRLTIFEFNTLLKKLDTDGGAGGVIDTNYFSLLQAIGGSDLRLKLADSSPSLGLAAKLDADTGVSDTDYLRHIEDKTGTIVSNTSVAITVISIKSNTFGTADVNTGTDTITIVGHGYTNGQKVTFTSTGTLPSGLVAATTYFIINATANTFQVSLTLGGSAVDITSTGAGTHTIKLSHELLTGRVITITGSNSTPSINGTHIVTVIDDATFSIPVTVTIPGTLGTYASVNGDFRDIQACYNKIISKLNADSGVAFSNYSENDTVSIQEAVITAINTATKKITLDLQLPFVLGSLTMYRCIPTNFVYTANTMGDPLGYKHLREATILFEDVTFTKAILSFASDLVPSFKSVTINGSGKGIFGHVSFGSGFFGGLGNSIPFRTYIPRNYQRCRYLFVKFEHCIAREQYAVLGHTITGEIGLSTRAYK